jgi:hypothetical protein
LRQHDDGGHDAREPVGPQRFARDAVAPAKKREEITWMQLQLGTERALESRNDAVFSIGSANAPATRGAKSDRER